MTALLNTSVPITFTIQGQSGRTPDILGPDGLSITNSHTHGGGAQSEAGKSTVHTRSSSALSDRTNQQGGEAQSQGGGVSGDGGGVEEGQYGVEGGGGDGVVKDTAGKGNFVGY